MGPRIYSLFLKIDKAHSVVERLGEFSHNKNYMKREY